MRKRLIGATTVFVAVLSSVQAFAQSFEVPLRNDRARVEAIYDRVSSAATSEDAKVMYAELPASLRGDVWLRQYEHYLAGSRDLTLQQRAVILEAVGLVLLGICDKARTDPQWIEWRDLSTRKIDAEAKAAFDRPTMKLIFMHLGMPSADRVRLRADSDGFHAVVNLLDDCQCSTEDDWCCVYPTCSSTCHAGIGYRCTFTQDGCGWWLDKPCNGLCD